MTLDTSALIAFLRQRCVHLCNHEVGTLIRSRGLSPAAAAWVWRWWLQHLWVWSGLQVGDRELDAL